MSDDTESRRPLRLLALDGGGIRGYSELKILQLMMHRIAWDKAGGRPPTGPPPLPCEYFDLIGGTSTGGIIAVLLGRMGVSVDDCLDMYSELASKIFGDEGRQAWSFWGVAKAKFSGEKLKDLVCSKVEKYLENPDAPMVDPRFKSQEAQASMPEEDSTSAAIMNRPTCRAFVCATRGDQVNRDLPTLIRSYTHRGESLASATEFKIWEAVRATSAAPTFFDPMIVGGHEYVDGGLGCNNPCKQVMMEAEKLWPGRKIGVIVSLGTGMPRTLSQRDIDVQSSWWPRDWVETLMRIATLCDKVHQDMQRDRNLRGTYFRFNVQQGMQTISLEEHKKLGEVATHTEVYLRDADISPTLDRAVTKILECSEAPDDDFEEEEDDDDVLPRYSR